jgi:hypothetical protein|uniref:Dynein light chain n=1 Tax=Oryza nivara TaxID=4536 RepID=A0A0E0G4S2_ORYNI
MLEGKARVEDTDMPARMQAAATSAASRALDLFDVADCRAIAGHIKAASCSQETPMDLVESTMHQSIRLCRMDQRR